MELNYLNDTFYNQTSIHPSTILASLSDQQIWTVSHFSALIIIVPLIFIGIVGNSLVIASWFADPAIRTPSNALLVSLAIPDILIWTFSAPLQLKFILNDANWLLGRHMCQLGMVAVYLLPVISSGHLILIAVDRYRILTEGVSYLQRRTTKSILEPVLWLWFIGFWLISPLLVDWEGTAIYEQNLFDSSRWKCSSKKATTLVLPFILVTSLLPELLLIRLYTEIYGMLKKRFAHKHFTSKEEDRSVISTTLTNSTEENSKDDDHNQVFKITDASTSPPSTPKSHQETTIVDHRQAQIDKKERRAAITLGILIIGFIVCWTPYMSLILIQTVFKIQLPHTFFLVFTMLGWLNSLINPIIYAVRGPDFQRAFRTVIKAFLGLPFRAVWSMRNICYGCQKM
jgi:hypothetical protein